jgi:hypothetical protein
VGALSTVKKYFTKKPILPHRARIGFHNRYFLNLVSIVFYSVSAGQEKIVTKSVHDSSNNASMVYEEESGILSGLCC